jgi:hypothetical protein
VFNDEETKCLLVCVIVAKTEERSTDSVMRMRVWSEESLKHVLADMQSGDAFCDTEVHQVRDFVSVGWPVGELTRG